MRKDSELFLEKVLQYRNGIEKDAFELELSYFSDIPNIEIEIEDIFEELIKLQCISKKSVILEHTIKLYLTLDGITYFDKKSEDVKGITFIVTGGQVNVATENGKIEAQQCKNIGNASSKIIEIEDNRSKSSTVSNGSGDSSWILGVIILLILTGVYLENRFQVQLGLVIASIVIEILTCLVYCSSKKLGIIYGKNIKEISYFNMSSIFLIPILIGIINSPIYTSKIRLDLLMQKVEKEGLMVAFFDSEYANYAVFQMLGMIFVAWFLMHIIYSDVYIIAIINIVMGTRGMWIWNGLLKMTSGGCKNWKKHVMLGVILMVVSILFVGGIFPYIIIKLNSSNLSNIIGTCYMGILEM